jgi:hypothetical protein
MQSTASGSSTWGGITVSFAEVVDGEATGEWNVQQPAPVRLRPRQFSSVVLQHTPAALVVPASGWEIAEPGPGRLRPRQHQSFAMNLSPIPNPVVDPDFRTYQVNQPVFRRWSPGLYSPSHVAPLSPILNVGVQCPDDSAADPQRATGVIWALLADGGRADLRRRCSR